MERGVVTKAKEEEADRASIIAKRGEAQRESPGAQRKHYILFLFLGKNRM